MQAFAVVDFGAHQVLQAERIDQQGDAVGFDREVVLALRFVELEAVLEAGTAATLDVGAQLQFGIAFLGDQLAHLGRGRHGEFQRTRQGVVIGGDDVVHAPSMGAAAPRFKRRAARR